VLLHSRATIDSNNELHHLNSFKKARGSSSVVKHLASIFKALGSSGYGCVCL
jgi:hypothetical protein